MSFVHLHTHTNYSLLDGLSNIKKLIAETKRMGMKSLAITDHGNMFGVLEFYAEAKKQNIKPIIGCEVYVAPKERQLNKPVDGESPSYHLVLLAKNNQGYKNLIKLTSYAYLEGFYYRPRIDRELLSNYSEGLIALSACMKGEVAYKLRTGRRESAIEVAEFYLKLFGDDYYFEIQDHGIAEEHVTFNHVSDLAKEMGVPVVATNDVHYLYRKDNRAHDILLCLQTGKDRDDPNRMRYNTQELYLKSPEEMYALFKDRPEVLENTLEVADKVDLEIDFSKHYLPEFPIPEGEGNIDADQYLDKLARRGLELRYKNITQDLIKRLEYELTVIREMGFAGYFLIVQDFINAARNRDIPVGLGRGSAAGSLVSYALGITDIDPIRYDLLFERFLNPERITLPDIDIDFCYEQRDQVIEYVKEKYGKKNVAQIITFGTMASRGVIRDVSRVLKIPIAKADTIAKQIPVIQGKPMPIEEAFENVPELKKLAKEGDEQISELIEYSKTLEGIPRHSSIHAAGIIIAPDDITHYIPLAISSLSKEDETNGKNDSKQITTQWTMEWCEAIGLLKMDFLGLRNLTVIHNTEKMIRKKYDKNFSIKNIPLDDIQTFQLFSEGRTIGIFQFESSGMQDYLRKLEPNRIEDLIAMNALYRPGPMEMIDDFIDRKKGKGNITYLHPKLEPILKETYGVIVYQEQVMRITSDLGGFSLAESDIMRRIMGKKKKKEMEEQKRKFIEGCIKNGINKEIAQKIAHLIEKFASYGFNKSHAAAYALIAYQTGYLKANYPTEFMAANLSSEMNNPDRIVTLIDDCRRMNIEVIPPDVNYSQALFEPIDNKKIAFGMGAIKNVGLGAIQSIVTTRKEYKNYRNIYQMLQYVDLRLVNKKVMESLAQCGALDSLEGNRAQKFYAVEQAIEFAQNYQNKQRRNQDQQSLFNNGTDADDLLSYPKLPDVADWSGQEKLKKEKELIGFYITGHPLHKYQRILKLYQSNFPQRDGFPDNKNGALKKGQSIVNIAGIITDVRTLLDKKQNKMAFVKIEDFNHSYEAVVFGSVYPSFEDQLRQDEIVLLKGRLNSEPDDSVIKIICEEVFPLKDAPGFLTECLVLHIDKSKITSGQIRDLKTILHSHPGKLPVYFKVSMNGQDEINMVSKKIKVSVDMSLIDELEKILSINNIKVKIKQNNSRVIRKN
jgi:DNA polymerase-3 subunit alpha